MKNKDLDLIKKRYGEDMAKFCRKMFSTVLETPGLLPEIMLKHFQPSHSLYNDVVKRQMTEDFVAYVLRQLPQKETNTHYNGETPEQLLNLAGYKLYKCETYEDMLKFKHYFTEGESLCSFRDPERTDTYVVFFAVKDGAENLKREDFTQPQRQDEYGTSVISIQFSKRRDSVLKITNRYNHTVHNPDATFSNDLDSIYPGLKQSFQEHYNINIINAGNQFHLQDYIQTKEGKWHKVLCEVEQVYYCEDNVVVQNNVATYYDKSRYEVFEYFVLDKQNKTITSNVQDGFMAEFCNIKKIDIINNKSDSSRKFVITKEDNSTFEFVVDKKSHIISYINHNQTVVAQDFLSFNEELAHLEIPNTNTIEDGAFWSVNKLKDIDLPKVEYIGSDCFKCLNDVKVLNIPELMIVEDNSLTTCDVPVINAPQLIRVGEQFLSFASYVEEFHAPNLEEMGDSSFWQNIRMKVFDTPKLKYVGKNCFSYHNNKNDLLKHTKDEIEIE